MTDVCLYCMFTTLTFLDFLWNRQVESGKSSMALNQERTSTLNMWNPLLLPPPCPPPVRWEIFPAKDSPVTCHECQTGSSCRGIQHSIVSLPFTRDTPVITGTVELFTTAREPPLALLQRGQPPRNHGWTLRLIGNMASGVLNIRLVSPGAPLAGGWSACMVCGGREVEDSSCAV